MISISCFFIGFTAGISGGALTVAILNWLYPSPWMIFLDKIHDLERKNESLIYSIESNHENAKHAMITDRLIFDERISRIETYLEGYLANRLSEIEFDIAGKKDNDSD